MIRSGPPRSSLADAASLERRLAIEHAVAAALECSTDLAEVAPSFVQALCEPLGLFCGACWIELSPGTPLACVGVWGTGGAEIDAFLAATRTMRWETEAGLPLACWSKEAPLWTSGAGAVSGTRAALAAAAGIHDAFAIPVTAEGRVIGVVEVFGGAMNEQDGQLLNCARFIGRQLGAFCHRARTEAQAREEGRRFADTVELAALGIAHVAAGGRFIYVNRWFCDMLGYTREELLGLSVKQISHPEDRNVTDDVRARMRSGEIPFFDLEKRYLRKNGAVAWVALRISLQRDAAGRPLHDIATFQDISGRRQAEHALAARERSMRLVLDNTGDGLVSATLEGIVDPEVSRAARDWLGAPAVGQTLESYLFGDDADGAAEFKCGFEQLAADVLPFDLAASQMPTRKQIGTDVLALEYKPIREGEKFVGVLVVLRNITAELEAKRREAEAREVHNMVGQILRSPQGFRTFIDETGRLLEIVRRERDPAIVKRALHTMKGNCSVYGIESVAQACHAVEDRLGAAELPRDGDVDFLTATWQRALDRVGEHVDSNSSRVDLEPDELARVKEMLHARADHRDILDVVHSWGAELVPVILERLSAQAKRIATGLGKEVEVIVDADPGRTTPEMSPFWSSLVHVIRNSVDHGIELPEDREAKGKPRAGRLQLSARRGPDRTFEVTITDDGGGIDLVKLERRARALSVPFTNERELLEAIFIDGLSTREVVTEISGRGAGLGAVRSTCESLGGKVHVRTSEAGTTFAFAFSFASRTWPDP